VANLFFLVSGEHETLPVSELKAILEAEGYSYQILEKLDQVIRIKADLACVEAIRRRSAFVRICAQELATCAADLRSIVKATHSIGFAGILKDSNGFAVRVKHVREYSLDLDGMILERKLGELVLDDAPEARVRLKKPDRTFVGVLTEGRFVLGVKLAEIEPKPFVDRRPRGKPFFHPSAMQAKLARCMVNLAKAKSGDLLLDPFCGTGSTLIEASFVGCRVLGLDIQRRMARGTRRNLAFFKVQLEGVIVGDARCLPVTKMDCVVTDPPYGISSSTLKRTTSQIVEELLVAVHDCMEKGRRVCFAAPKTLKISGMCKALGYKHLESHFVYVHRSLTREVIVLEKV